MRLALLALVLCLCSATAFAETIDVYDLGYDDEFFAPQINANGVVLVELRGGTDSCAPLALQCYAEFTAGRETYYSDAAPTNFVPDNGVACSPPVGGSGRSVCNNGFEVFDYEDGDLNYDVHESFPGGDPRGIFITRGSTDVVSLNSSGAFIVIDGRAQETYQVIVGTTPEPSTVALLGSGLLGLAGIARRRIA